MNSFASSFCTSFASGLKTQVMKLKLVQNEMDPEAAGGQKTAWQGLHLLPHIPFQKGSTSVSTPWSGSTGLWSTKPASLPAPEAEQKAVAAGGLY